MARSVWNKPRIIATIFTVPALITLIGLGFWQVQRLHWKSALIADRQAAVSASPVLLTAKTDLSELDFKPVRLVGRFLDQQSLFIYPRSMNRVSGVHVLMPFELMSGGVIIVNRGFIATNGVAPKNWQDPISGETFALSGILRRELNKPYGVGEDIDKTGLIGWYDLTAMANYFDLELMPAIIEASNSPHSGEAPYPGQTMLSLPNNHASYAFTWFCLAAAWLVIFVIFWRREKS